MRTTPRPDLVLPELIQGQWTTALITTFGADLTFFETRLLHQLAQVPLRLVLADHRLLTETLAEAARTGQRHRLANKGYVAAPVRHARAAHGKLVLLLGPSEGLLVVGSGNLGYEGYAAPGELWHVFAYAEDRAQHIGEFAAARSYIEGLARRGLLDPPVVELLEAAWGEATWLPAAPDGPTAITSNLDRPILDQLREAVTEPVVELVAHAPFHDADCAALRELIDVFAPKRVRLLLTDDTSADAEAINRTLAAAPSTAIDRVQVRSEPAAYIHAKWVHLIHRNSETLLTGSANLSRSALLWSAGKGNTEIAVISTGRKGAFNHLYDHLQPEPVHDPSTLGISFRADNHETPSPAAHPVVLWARLDGTRLTMIFDRVLPPAPGIELQDHAGRPLTCGTFDIYGTEVRASLSEESAALLAEGGRVQVRLDADDAQVSECWPYHLANLRGRLSKASQREHLPRIADLPEQDAELYALLEELDKSLIIDRVSAWRIAKPKDPLPRDADEGPPGITLEDLDWARVRRDPRYSGYFAHSRSRDLPPTDVQIILAAIAGRLGEIGLAVPRTTGDDDEDLAHEGDVRSSEADDEDELEDELNRRHLPVSTRTRMAFDRFVRRYAAALQDSTFMEELGPIPAASNAVVFNHLLVRLLERSAVSPRWAVAAQLATWAFLWGGPHSPGIASILDEEMADLVRQVLLDTQSRATTLRGLAIALEHADDDESTTALRDAARLLLTEPEFALDDALLIEATGGISSARGLLDQLGQAAAPQTDGEILDLILTPLGLPRSSGSWRHETVNRRGRGTCQSNTLVITAPVTALTPKRAEEALAWVAVAAHYAGHDGAYVRVRFEGNGKSVAFWDADASRGMVMIEDQMHPLDAIAPPWPEWELRISDLRAQLARRAGKVSA